MIVKIVVGAALTLACVGGALYLRRQVHAARWEALALINCLRGYH